MLFCCRTTRPDARRQFRATQVNQQANNSTMTLVHLGLRTCDWMQRLKRLLTTRKTTTTYKVMWHGLVNHLGLGTCDWTQRLKPLLATNTTTTTYKTTQQFFVTFWDSSRHTRQSCGMDYDQRDNKKADLTRAHKQDGGARCSVQKNSPEHSTWDFCKSCLASFRAAWKRVIESAVKTTYKHEN